MRAVADALRDRGERPLGPAHDEEVVVHQRYRRGWNDDIGHGAILRGRVRTSGG